MTVESFRAAMRQTGLDHHSQIVADGKLHRFKAGDDHNANSWFVLYPGNPAAGAFGCWKRGVKEIWCERDTKQVSPAQWAQVRKQWQRADAEREAAEANDRAEAKRTAARILSESQPASGDHPYLARKGIAPAGVREWKGKLVIPLRDAMGELHSLQFIGPDGAKMFLRGGRVQGCFFVMSA